jgi:hypothetical protein
MTPGPGEKFDYLLKSMKSRVDSPESRVETEESRTMSKPEVEIPESRAMSLESRVDIQESVFKSLDNRALEEALEEASRKPKLGVYSPLAAAMLRYKAITTPRYSMGSELRTVVEQALKEAYPELYEEVQRKMKENQG